MGNVSRNNLIVVFCYIIRDGEVLLIRRNCPPALHEITVPGGKKELNESLLDAVRREIFEETGLTIKTPRLKGLISNGVEGVPNEVLTCYFLTNDFEGELRSSSEGDLLWCDITESYQLENISKFYLQISPYVLDKTPEESVFHGRLQHTLDGNIQVFTVE